MTLKASLLGNFKNFTHSMTLKASPLGNFKNGNDIAVDPLSQTPPPFGHLP